MSPVDKDKAMPRKALLFFFHAIPGLINFTGKRG